MRIYLLRFTDRSALSSAFARVADESDVASCVIDADELRLRFVSPHDSGEELLEQIYADGGLSWTSRHDVEGLESRFGNAF